MTECNRQPLLFSSLNRQQVVADFNGGTLTSDAGGLLLREVDRRLGLTRRLADCIPDPREPREGTAARAVRRSHQLPSLRGQPVSCDAGGGRVRAHRAPAANGAQRHRAGACTSLDHPHQTAQGRRPRGDQRPADRPAPGQQLSPAGPLPPPRPAARARIAPIKTRVKRMGVRGQSARKPPPKGRRSYYLYLAGRFPPRLAAYEICGLDPGKQGVVQDYGVMPLGLPRSVPSSCCNGGSTGPPCGRRVRRASGHCCISFVCQ